MADTMATLAPSTPSGDSSIDINTPPAPHQGYGDSWDPYTPRKSSRIAQRTANRTPSPHLSSRKPIAEPTTRATLSSPKASKKNMASSMATPSLSPQKKRTSHAESSRSGSGLLTADGAASAAAAFGLSGRSGISTSAGMLITPAKTPQKPPTENSKAKVSAIARNLFVDEAMPSPKKTRGSKNYVLDSFIGAQETEEPIQIYTDSHERIPEIDRSLENPFYGDHVGAPEPSLRRSKRHITVPGEGKVSIEEAVRRDDGMLIVFRGKKTFRKFTDLDEAPHGGLDETDAGLGSSVEARTRPLTRSSIKPRLLFPVKQQPQITVDDDDEEAATDIEDHVLEGLETDSSLATPGSPAGKTPATPSAPRFAPATPPTTMRTTRFGSKKATDGSPASRGHSGKISPFDGWRRNKGSSDGAGQKRSGETLAAAPLKRARA